MKYGIGLDIGITSVGSAVVLLDGNGEPAKIHRLSSRIFDAAEVPKTGAPLAKDRTANAIVIAVKEYDYSSLPKALEDIELLAE